MTGDTSEKCILVLSGPTSSGKTTSLEAIRFALGEYAGQVLIESLMANSRQSDANAKADLADWKGCRFVTTSEAEATHRLAEGRLKYLTQGQLEPGAQEGSSAVYESYGKWNRQNGEHREFSRQQFGDRLERLGCERERRRNDQQKQLRVWTGIRLL